ncbi:MAG: type II CAAX endopeptidase family protein [Deltaproteobacteria bacterium]|nr:type II CAAX endopeptidase family protein [Deltaproteobacteria bacterium]
MNKILFQSLGVTLGVLLLLKFAQIFLPASWMGLLTPALLLYVPFFILTRRGEAISFIDRSWRQFGLGCFVFLITVLVIFPPYMVAAHYWMMHVFHFQHFVPASWTHLFDYAGYQLLVVAIPEEFFFRGYLQTQFNKVWQTKWRLLGANLGWGWIVASLVFAFAHSVISLQWWHFSIFFPALLFGYLKERTGSITAPVLFHTFCNCFMNWFAASYF